MIEGRGSEMSCQKKKLRMMMMTRADAIRRRLSSAEKVDKQTRTVYMFALSKC